MDLEKILQANKFARNASSVVFGGSPLRCPRKQQKRTRLGSVAGGGGGWSQASPFSTEKEEAHDISLTIRAHIIWESTS